MEEAELSIPANRHAPIAARLRFSGPAHSANFDWREQGSEAWTIAIDTGSGKRITLFEGGARLGVDEAEQLFARMGEYTSFDHAGRLLQRNAQGDAIESFICEGLGRLTLSTDVHGGTTTFVFNDAGSTTTFTTSSGVTGVQTFNRAGEAGMLVVARI